MLKRVEKELPITGCWIFGRYLSLAGAIIALVTLVFVLFYPPMPGVADQGDFQRVMNVTGLAETKTTANDNSHWFKYVTTKYEMLPLKLDKPKDFAPLTTIFYPIALARIMSKFFGMQSFSTKFLAFVYSIMYILGLYICFRYIKLKKLSTYIFFITLSLFIFIDGNYVVWFNSLYGEPMMIISLLLLSASILYAYQQIEQIGFIRILLIFICVFLFIGAKMQCFPALPFIILFIFRLFFTQNRKNIIIMGLPVVILILALISYTKFIYVKINSSCGLDTQYNSVFYGILKESENPKKDLEYLGLPTDMAAEAGKHAYLPKNQYVKYVPLSDLTVNEFNKKISNFKLLKFYLFHPSRLMIGMEYTASKCFDTGTSLGKYSISDVKEYTPNFKRFTLWSDFRSSKLPKKLSFIALFYISVIVISFIQHLKRFNDKHGRLQIELLWLIMIIGLLQFPMPYIGNGEADTAKQLFLFNYTFDIVFLVSCTWIFDNIINLWRNK